MAMIAEDLARLLDDIKRPGEFSVGGTCDLLAPRLEVEGVGPIALPLLPAQAEAIVAVAKRAPFGRGARTVVDTSVRRTWQIGTDQVAVSGGGWNRTLAGIVARVAEGLGVAGPVAAELYKLLVYDEGSFFTGHRDTEKAPSMFATLVIVLPSASEGGDLVVRHAGREDRYDMRCPEPSQAAFAAFYADCLHEVLPVTSGHRLTLVYNLVRSAAGKAPHAPDDRQERAALADRLRRWGDDDPAKLVVPLAHAYTPAGLSFPALKGADTGRAAALAAAAEDAGCDLHLALLTVEESGSAEQTGGYGWGRRGRYREEAEEAFEVVEVSDRSETLSDWQRPDGTPAGLGPLPLGEDEVAPPGALDDLAPDHQSFQEATGNEGASFERSYRRVALVVWPKARRLEVVNQGGLAATQPLLSQMADRWLAEGGGDRASAAWTEAHALSGHMLAAWPQTHRGYGAASDKAITLLGSLCRLGDAERIEQALRAIVAERFYFKGQTPEILAALRLLPRSRVAPMLEALVAGNAGVAFSDAADLLQAAAAPEGLGLGPDALRLAARALLAAMPGLAPAGPEPAWSGPRRIGSGAVADGLAAFERIDPGVAREAVRAMLAHPALYGLDDTVIPALLKLRDATEARRPLLAAALVHLDRRIAEPLAPPADATRDATLTCRCSDCADLGRFLADPKRETWTLKASESERSHVANTVGRSGSDLDCKTLKQGRPYTLLCTKTDASYRRRAAQREQDLSARARLGVHHGDTGG